ncbi:histidinol-phosphate aminotransferase [Scopulibacillus darangshiensis]|uniref:Histidinol-phosphate aminotransferase n=1 Tax=Scopulibacillus darangshiensis TaxID=442528 RepID=A0A4R2PBE7_9BACL|nr:histidinol-phosphate transaminase [Scopulibacillus darangshiensis]TCP31634.1 histidinol-phosphate aminotransferase [Scopulibacillus darangshiensis]
MKEQLKTLKPYQPGKQVEEVKKELGLEKIEKLASNENPFGCSPKAIKGMQKVFGELAIYPDGYATVLRKKISAHFHISEDQIIFGNGTDEIIHMISRAYLEPGLNTIMADLTFPQYKRNAVIDGAEVREVPLVHGRHDLDTMRSLIDENTKVIWLCNPNNPSGEYIRESELTAFLDTVPSDVLVVSDEAYYEYVTAEDYPQSLNLIQSYPNLIFTRTFSKAYGMAALRIGYGIANPELIRSLEAVREPFNASRLAQAAAAEALEDQEFIAKCAEKNNEGKQQYYDFCDDMGLACYPTQGNFILIDVGGSGEEAFKYLLSKGYIVRSGAALGYPKGIRITIGNKEQNDAIISHLRNYLT